MTTKHSPKQRIAPFTEEDSSGPVSFRLSPEQRNLLAVRAKNDGLGRNAWAKAATLEALSHNPETDPHDRMTLLEQNMRELRKDVALATEALLLSMMSKDSMTPEQIRSWVKTTLNRSSKLAPDGVPSKPNQRAN